MNGDIEGDIDLELSYLTSQLNESMQSPEINSLRDVICDVVYVQGFTSTGEPYVNRTIDLLLNRIVLLQDSGLITDGNERLTYYRNFTVDYNVEPSTLIFTHYTNLRRYLILIEDLATGKVRTEVHDRDYTLEHVTHLSTKD